MRVALTAQNYPEYFEAFTAVQQELIRRYPERADQLRAVRPVATDDVSDTQLVGALDGMVFINVEALPSGAASQNVLRAFIAHEYAHLMLEHPGEIYYEWLGAEISTERLLRDWIPAFDRAKSNEYRRNEYEADFVALQVVGRDAYREAMNYLAEIDADAASAYRQTLARHADEIREEPDVLPNHAPLAERIGLPDRVSDAELRLPVEEVDLDARGMPGGRGSRAPNQR